MTGQEKTGANLITAQNLSVWFELRHLGLFRAGSVRAVDGVDFEIGRGESVAIVGESGCGKSTLARTLLGIHKPTGGKITIEARDGRIEMNNRGAVRARPGYIQQDPYGALPPFMDLRRILSEPLVINRVRNREEIERRIHGALEEARLSPPENFLPKFPHMLSGGQQQRVVIARALILRPEFIVADEPVSMIDASVRVEIISLLAEIQASRKLTMVIITHDLSSVRYFAKRVFVMYAGRIVEKGPVESLVEKPLHPYTRAMLQAVADPDAENARRMQVVPPGEPPSLVHPPRGCRFHPRCRQAIKGLCDSQPPPEKEPVTGRSVECWLY